MTQKLDKPFEISTICKEAWYCYVNGKITKKELLDKMEKLQSQQIPLEIQVKENKKKNYNSWRSTNV